MRRNAIIGLTIPARHIEKIEFRRSEAQGLSKTGGARRVAGDMHKDRRPLLGLARQRAGDVGAQKGVEALRRVGKEQLLAPLEPFAHDIKLQRPRFCFRSAQ